MMGESIEKPLLEHGAQGNYHLLEESNPEEVEDSHCEEEDDDAPCLDGDESANDENRFLYYATKNWTPDRKLEWRGATIMELTGVKLMKFVLVTFVGIIVMHYLVRGLDWERDKDYTLVDMVLYDGNLIVLDMFVFFCVGRLYRQRGIDYAAWVLVACISAVCMSWETTFAFLRYSASLYQIRCVWPWKLWVFVAVLVPLVGIVILYHVQYAYQHGLLARKGLELSLSLIFFIAPYISHPSFHLHHWYLGFVLGMQCNLDVWWSQATMAWMWGFYINGVAVYGRDPILTCAYLFYHSTDLRCPYMACHDPPHGEDSTLQLDKYNPMPEPNWRNCTGYSP